MVHHTHPGKLFLIGAGPGDPELLTLKAVRALGECDVVLYDRLVNQEILSHVRSHAELLYVGKLEGEQHSVQERIFALIIEHASAGKVVGRLKGGDPFIFGRGAEEWALALKHGIQVEVVPGISSAISVPGLAGVPPTYRRLSQGFAIVTGHLDDAGTGLWRRYKDVDTLVILMGVKNRQSIASGLIEAGRPPREPVAFIHEGTLPGESVVVSRLDYVAAGLVEVENPAIFVVGEVVSIREQLGLTSLLQLNQR